MIDTSEYIFSDPKLDEINDFIKNTRLEHHKETERIKVEKLRLDVTLKILIKQKTKQKNITVKHYHVRYGKNKTMIASQGRYELIEPNKLIILIESFYKNIINTYLNCIIPFLW